MIRIMKDFVANQKIIYLINKQRLLIYLKKVKRKKIWVYNKKEKYQELYGIYKTIKL